LAQDLAEPCDVRWGDLRKRVVSAAILAPLALVAIWFGATAWTVLITVVTLGLACEWVQLCGFRVAAMPGIAVPLAVLVAGAAAVDEHERAALLLLLAGSLAAWLIAHAHARRTGGSSRSRAEVRRPVSLAAGIGYVGLACIAMIWLRHDGDVGRWNVLFLVLVVWATDVGAYLSGRLIGGPRLAPSISPSKTWAGALGGLAMAIVFGSLVAHGMGGHAGVWRVALVAAALGAVAQSGDLLESLIKRRFGVKDSGRVIPGHGGLLDRLDGVLAAAPAAALLALALGRGVVLWR
jgi:phosphatidate cytidylyltransferase